MFPLSVRAGESTVSVRRISFVNPENSIEHTSFTVANNASVSHVYEVSSATIAPFAQSAIRISPTHFTLSPGETQAIQLHLRVPHMTSHGTISVLAHELAEKGRVAIGAGIRIPIDITQPFTAPPTARAGLATTLFIYALDALIAAFMLTYWARKKHRMYSRTQRI